MAQLIQQKLDDQFVECLGFTTDLDPEMRQKLVFGKLGVAFSDNRKPRLVLDITISGVNPRTSIQEKVFYPTVADVRETFSAQPQQQQYLGFLVDIRAGFPNTSFCRISGSRSVVKPKHSTNWSSSFC